MNQIVPITQRVLPVAPQVVETEQPHVCVHTDLINEVDEWKIQRTLQLVREMGATTIVEFFPWAYFETSKDHFDWFQADRIIEHAEQQGLQVIARIGLVPGWVRPEQTTLNHLPDGAFDDFAEYVEAFARRYAGRVNHIIIWNEPNLAFEWGFQDFSPERYMRLLEAVYERAHAVNPDLVILAGALAPTLEPAGSPNGMNDVIYLQRMFEAGAANYMDALAIHTYGFTEDALAPPSEDVLNFRRAELLLEVLENYAPNMPVYITESGWNDNLRWVQAVRPSRRIGHTLDAFQWTDANWNNLEAHCLWLFRYTRLNGNYRDNYTLITPEFQLKPIYYAVQAYARGFEQEDNLWLSSPTS